MGKDTGFLEFQKENPTYRDVKERIQDYKEYDGFHDEQQIRQQASRCMDCGIPFCHTGCPLGNLIPNWNDLVYRGNWKEASYELHKTNNFPDITGRICPAPCEDSCVLNSYYTLKPEEKLLRKNSVTIEQVEKHITERAWENGWIVPQQPKHFTGKRIAIVGSGPAGMSAAQQLRSVGHDVVVYEKNSRIGGITRYGIPDFKLDKMVLVRRQIQMEAEGIIFYTNVEIGKDITMAELKKEYDAVLLAIGSEYARKLRVPGANLKGIHYAMDYLPQQNQVNAGDVIPENEQINATGKQCLILGGGFTAADCLGTITRQGGRKLVRQFEIVNMQPRPTPAHQEIETDCRANTMTEEVIGDSQGNVKQLKACKVSWKNENGRMSMEKIPNSEFVVDTDMIFLATGFLGPRLNGPVEELGLAMSLRGSNKSQSHTDITEMLKQRDVMFTIQSNDRFTTSEEGIFVAGDARRGASLVVWAIWEGREAARHIDIFLTGKTELLSSPQMESFM